MFIGRISERQRLSALIRKKEPAIGVIYGRRRIGKTELIKKAFEKANTYSFEGLENQPKREQIKNFLLQLSLQSRETIKAQKVKSWREAFILLFEAVKKKRGSLVFDEFQWMANYRAEIVSDLKMVWDQFFSQIPGVKLILCGSIASFMTTKVVKSSALYGRTDLIIHLKGFHLAETREMLATRGLNEVIEAQMYFGGIPKYIDLAKDKPSIRLAMEELAFTENGYLVDEYDRIFISHFGKNPDYQKIVKTLADHPYGLFRQQLSDNASIDIGGGLTNHLIDLESAGFISSATPFDKGHTSRYIKYHLSDPYLRMYFAFILPMKKKILSGAHSNLFAGLSQTGNFSAWMGRSFEYLCIDHARKIAKILGFFGIDFSFGPFFQSAKKNRPGVQIDLVFDRADNVITLCEMKHARSPMGMKVIQEVERKGMILQDLFPRRTIQKVLVLHGEPSRNLLASDYFYRIISASELF